MEKLEEDMKPKLIGETWRKYPTEKSTQKATYGLFECPYCGNAWEVITAKVNMGHTISCGCLRGGKPIHGMSSNKFYKTWHSMIYRCNNPKNKKYKDYGARGITVCEEWLDVKNFIEWCDQTYIEGMTLDRIDNNNKGYNPDNCRWVSKSEQAMNRRMKSINTSGYTGVSYKIRDGVWTANIGINNKLKHLGTFLTIEEAVLARDNYIIENKLPHKLSTDYIKETK